MEGEKKRKKKGTKSMSRKEFPRVFKTLLRIIIIDSFVELFEFLLGLYLAPFPVFVHP